VFRMLVTGGPPNFGGGGMPNALLLVRYRYGCFG
jgi:hypothetical protein